MSDSQDFAWVPIVPLSDSDKSIDLADIHSLYSAWREAKARYSKDRPVELADFNKRLIRRLSVETGILERLYDLDRGTTEALVAKGFSEELVSHSSTDIQPGRLIDILRDQEAAVQLVLDWVAGSRDLTKSSMNELHAILTRHQPTTTAVDQFGNRQEIDLLKGTFKRLPNNPRRPDGLVHQYCPPLQTDSEVEKLLDLHQLYLKEGIDPIVHAAWLHHRFTQIHPYQDGNGRVVRALVAFVLLKANLLPLVVDRDLRTKYIESLEVADGGKLEDLIVLFANLERSAIAQALSVEASSDVFAPSTVSSAVISGIRQKLQKRQESHAATMRSVNEVALKLRELAKSKLDTILEDLRKALAGISAPNAASELGGTDLNNAHWYKYEVVQTAKDSHTFANLAENHYFVKSKFRMGTDRLVFVVSFHHVGRELSGVMEATAFAKLESGSDPEDVNGNGEKLRVCSTEPFIFTSSSQFDKLRTGFDFWLDSAAAVALKEFADRI